jgi:uncharacterized protein YndB with AHSA1/START domain
MSRLFVDESVEIDASAQRVWAVLTSPEHTREWASEFSAGGPEMHIESDWTLGSAVLWKDRKGRVIVEGNVRAIEPNGLLRYTVFDLQGPRHAAGPDDGITFKLTERGGKTVLWVSQGDFSLVPEGAKYRDLTEEIWARALVRIKRLAEGRTQGARLGQ